MTTFDIPGGKLSDTCFLCVLRVHQFSPNVQDKVESERLRREKRANAKRFKVTKRTIEAAELTAITKISSAARQEFNFYTRPWAADGARIVPGALWFELGQRMQTHKDRFDQAVNIAALKWDEIIERNRPQLGDGFDRGNYPTAEKFRSSYSMSWEPFTLPTSEAFSSNLLSDDAVEEIKRKQDERTRQLMAEGSKQVTRAVYDAVERMVERYGAYERDEKGNRKTKLHETVVTNLKDLVRILPAMNLERDPALDDLAKRIEDQLTSTPIEEIKENDYQRRAVAQDAEAILASMQGYCNAA